jgi:hypothetical protein
VRDLWEVQEDGKLVFAEMEKAHAEIERLPLKLDGFERDGERIRTARDDQAERDSAAAWRLASRVPAWDFSLRGRNRLDRAGSTGEI